MGPRKWQGVQWIDRFVGVLGRGQRSSAREVDPLRVRTHAHVHGKSMHMHSMHTHACSQSCTPQMRTSASPHLAHNHLHPGASPASKRLHACCSACSACDLHQPSPPHARYDPCAPDDLPQVGGEGRRRMQAHLPPVSFENRRRRRMRGRRWLVSILRAGRLRERALRWQEAKLRRQLQLHHMQPGSR